MNLIRISVLFAQFFLLLLPAIPAIAAPPLLELPIRCDPGLDCFIQNYFDHDPGAGYYDYKCGKLSYNGHHGTDFRLRDLAAMRKKVMVVAAAPGAVVSVRDGEPDQNVRLRGKNNLNGKEAGNGVRIDHGDGWATQYSHLLLGSVAVRKGQRVKAGEPLGMVGLSGNTEFPHLDFSISRDGKPVDPFSLEPTACGASAKSLWSLAALTALHYQSTGLLISGFAAAPPEREIAESGGYDAQIISTDSESIVFWAELFGLQKDDLLTLELYGPGKQRISNSRSLLPGDKAVWFAYSGKRSKGLWPKGRYSALIRLERAGRVVLEEQRGTEVR